VTMLQKAVSLPRQGPRVRGDDAEKCRAFTISLIRSEKDLKARVENRHKCSEASGLTILNFVEFIHPLNIEHRRIQLMLVEIPKNRDPSET
jgi:hypothetical protein